MRRYARRIRTPADECRIKAIRDRRLVRIGCGGMGRGSSTGTGGTPGGTSGGWGTGSPGNGMGGSIGRGGGTGFGSPSDGCPGPEDDFDLVDMAALFAPIRSIPEINARSVCLVPNATHKLRFSPVRVPLRHAFTDHTIKRSGTLLGTHPRARRYSVMQF